MAFNSLNEIMWTLSLIAPLTEQNGIISQVLKELKSSQKLCFYLKLAPTPHQALQDYKRAAVQELAEHFLKFENFQRQNSTFEKSLFATYFPRTLSLPKEVETTVQAKLTDLCETILSPSRKRSFSKFTEGSTAQYKVECPESKSWRKRGFSKPTEGRTVQSTEKCPESKSSEPKSLVREVTSATKRRRYENLSNKGRYSKF